MQSIVIALCGVRVHTKIAKSNYCHISQRACTMHRQCRNSPLFNLEVHKKHSIQHCILLWSCLLAVYRLCSGPNL